MSSSEMFDNGLQTRREVGVSVHHCGGVGAAQDHTAAGRLSETLAGTELSEAG
jgi:hypothetical protein